MYLVFQIGVTTAYFYVKDLLCFKKEHFFKCNLQLCTTYENIDSQILISAPTWPLVRICRGNDRRWRNGRRNCSRLGYGSTAVTGHRQGFVMSPIFLGKLFFFFSCDFSMANVCPNHLLEIRIVRFRNVLSMIVGLLLGIYD